MLLFASFFTALSLKSDNAHVLHVYVCTGVQVINVHTFVIKRLLLYNM